jgi:hypothetical protein
MAVLSEFQQALERRDFGEAQRLRDLRTPIEAGTYEGWFSPGDEKIGLAGKTIQPIFIYPKVDMGNERDSGNFVDTGKNKYIWTGDWQLTDEQHREFDKNVKRALSESGLGVLPTKVKNSRKLLREWQSDNDQYGIAFPEEGLGVGNHHMREGVVPYYIVRGMGGYAGATPGNTDFAAPFSMVGDTVIESLAGFKGLTSYARILMDRGTPEDEAKYMASRQSQMGSVLHEAMHMTGALPHTADEGGLQDYTVNYGGQHGEEFMHAVTADVRGERSEDSGQAMRLVMGEQWNYGWGTDANPDGVVAEPVTSDKEFKAIAKAPEHLHPHKIEFAHESAGETIPTSLDPVDISKQIESKEDMAKVPFRKNANGQWEVFGNGQWQSTPELQQVLQDVESVRAVTASDGSTDYEFTYGTDPGGITGDAPGVWTLDDIERRYNNAIAVSGGASPSQSSSDGGAADIFESWYSVNTTTLPDLYMRDDGGSVIMSDEYEDEAGNTVPEQPVIDPTKMERVIEILRQQGAWEIQEPTVFSVPGVKDNFVRVGDKIFKSSPPDPVAKEYKPGVVPEKGPDSINLPGYDILQDREGGLTPYAERYKPTYHIDPKTMTPFIQQPDGSLEVADIPTIDELVTQYLVTGQSGKAVAMANFRDRPSPMEYFQAAMEWARTPADIFTVSAIVRGMFEPELGEIGDVRRVGAPPSWARDAWIALQSSMGVPAQNMSSEPGDAEGSFVAKGGDASGVPTIQSEFGIGNIEATDSNVSAGDAEALFQDTGVLAKDEGMAAAGDADSLFSGVGFGPSESGPYGAQDSMDVIGTESIDSKGGGGWSAADFAEFRAGSIDAKITDILAAGGVLQSDGSYLAQDGTRWDNAGNPIGGQQTIGGQTATLTIFDAAGNRLTLDANLAEDYLAGGNYGLTPDWNIEEPLIEEPFTGTSVPSWMTQSAGGDDVFMSPGAIGTSDTEEGMGIPGMPSGDTAGAFARLMSQDINPEDFANIESEADMVRRMNESGGAFTTETDDYFTRGMDDFGVTIGSSGAFNIQEDDYFPQATAEQMAAAQPYDYSSEGGSLASDIELEAERAFEAGNRALAAQLIEEGNRMRDIMANQPPPSASSFVTATQPRGSILTPPMTPVGTDFGGGGDEYVTTPGGVGTLQPPAPIYYPEDDIPEYIAPAPAPVFSTPTPAPVSTGGAYGASARGGNYPSNEPHSSQIMQSVAYQPSWVEPGPEPLSWINDGAEGMRTDNRLSLVGESGPELALFPNGTEIIPLDREMKPNQKRRLRRRGAFADAIDSFEFGGMVGGMGPEVSDLPLGAQTNVAGVTEMLSGRPTRRPRSLFRTAGLRAPSAQTISNLIPSEIEAYQELALTKGGIGQADFEREFRSMVPMGQGGVNQARFTPRGTGRTRYGSR